MTPTTPILDLPLLAPAQAQKHVIVNEAMALLDAVVQLRIIDHQRTDPPPGAEEGDRYVVPPGATGAWSGAPGQLAVRLGGDWRFVRPAPGWLAWSDALGTHLRYDGAAWQTLDQGAPDSLPSLGINTPSDPGNVLSVRGNTTLLAAETDDHRLSISKSASQHTGSVLFQSGFSGRAEIGLVGRDTLRVRTSDDGAVWSDALEVGTGGDLLKVGTEPGEALTIESGTVALGYSTFTAEQNLNAPSFSLMAKATGHRNSYFDLHACDDYAGYSARVIRFQGPNSPFILTNRGLGAVILRTEDAAPISFETQSVSRLYINAVGRVGIGTTAPTAALDVRGAVRIGRYDSQSLPDPQATGDGSLAYATDGPLGPGLVICDGTGWAAV